VIPIFLTHGYGQVGAFQGRQSTVLLVDDDIGVVREEHLPGAAFRVITLGAEKRKSPL
jgi:hypothetical protein